MSSKVRWGILSTARIARDKVIPAMHKASNVEVVAISSRNAVAAREAAEDLHIRRAHDGYEALLSDPEVEAVYVPLPNHMHVDWSIRALEAGKHVLVEKPIGLSTAEAQRLADVAAQYPKLKVMEAFMYRFHPQWIRAKDLVERGEIGRLQTVHSHFSYLSPFRMDPTDIRNQRDAGGGGLMDIGTYNISLSRFLFGREPDRVIGMVDLDPMLQVDRMVSSLMDFGDGCSAIFTCGTQMVRYQRVHALGSTGRVELEIPFNAPLDGPSRLWQGSRDGTHETVFDRVDQYALQAEAFSDAILNDAPVPIPLSDAIANMRVIDAILESSWTREWVQIGG